MSKTIGIVGCRVRDSRKDLKACRLAFGGIFEEGDKIVSGGYPQGGDRFAEVIAKNDGLSITIHFPDWEKHGKAAGFVRNSKIVEDCDVLIAVVHPNRMGGTEDTIKKTKKLGKKVMIV